MRLRHLALRGFLFHWRLHVGTLLGTAVAAAVLTGALLVGVSVQRSLQEAATARLGTVTHALESGTRFLAEATARRLQEKLGAPVAPLLQARAVALRRGKDGSVIAATGVKLYGIDESFRRFVPRGSGHAALRLPGEGEVLVNRRLARELDAAPGDLITLRIGKAAVMPLDAPLAAGGGKLTRLGSFTVAAIVPREELGDFNLRAEQVPPANVFVDLGWLQDALEQEGSVNLLLAGGEGTAFDTELVNDGLADIFDLGAAGYRLNPYPDNAAVQLESRRVFLDHAAVEAALALPGATGSLTWLVDSLTRREGADTAATPYSFVAAVSPSTVPGLSPVPADMEDQDIILNGWTATELGARPGDTVTVAYSMPTPGGAFVSHSRPFRVHSIAPMEDISAERQLVPSFPGLTNADSCGDWDIGMPLDEEKLADEPNERYWQLYRQTPKAFITLAAGRELWSNRWGDLTAVRYPAAAREGVTPPALSAIAVAPGAVGYIFQPVAEEAGRAVADSIDFGGLFLGMSLFIIAAALALTSMLHSFSIQQRRREIGTLMALGLSARQVTFIFFSETVLTTAAGAVIGGVCGSLYTRALLWGLGSFWQDAVAGTAIDFYGSASALIGGAGAAFIFSAAAQILTLRHQRGRQVRELVADGSAEIQPAGGRRAGRAAAGGILAALLVSLYALASQRGDPAVLFFLAGTLLLGSLLAGLYWAMHRLNRSGCHALGPGGFALRNALRRRGRSLGTAGIFACGCFIVVAVSSMRTDTSARSGLSWSGTGGFSLYGETVLPLPAGSMIFTGAAERRNHESTLAGLGVVPFKVRDGDDASCFNLNRAQAPRLLGVDPGALISRRSFIPSDDEVPLWELLRLELPDGIIPGLVGDRDTAMWNLALGTGSTGGDEIAYVDERGAKFRVRLVGALPVRKSVLQGSIIINGNDFAKRFPSVGGYRAFLFDGGGTGAGPERAFLEDTFADFGMDISSTAERLRIFFAVENTYLDIFLLLGGLGLVLASLGLGVVVLRSVIERQSEHALLRTLGFPHRVIGRLLFLEHAGLFGVGLAAGCCAALLAVAPLLIKSRAELSLKALGLLLAGLVAAGLVWIFLAEKFGTRKSPIPALRQE